VTYRPRNLKQAKTPMSAAAWRYFMAPRCSTADFYAACAESEAEGKSGEATADLLGLYYFHDEWKNLWRGHKVAIEAEWLRRFPDPEERTAHKKWALQSYNDRLHQKFMAERDSILQ
jgi:hypothetical protein